MSQICVYEHSHKDFFRCAKDSVYGSGAFLEGFEYSDLQSLLNTNIRTNRHLLRWADEAPSQVQEIDIMSPRSYARCHQKWLKLTDMGTGRLQIVLVDHFGTMQEPSQD